MNVIGIESSCDETSVAVISNGKLKANLIASQTFHTQFGGVVPELSSRAHLQAVQPMVKEALKQASIDKTELNLICATAGPGLIGALLVGLNYAKGLAYSLQKDFIAVNHIEGHIFSGFLMDEKPEFPYLTVAVSGGHTLLLLVKSFTEIKLLGTTIDDAAGEAFDKVAKMLGVGYPGGPKIQQLSMKGDSKSIDFPVAQCKNKFDFSFSGLKTSVLRYIQSNYSDVEIPSNDIQNIAASFQDAVVRQITQRIKRALKEVNVKSISLVGGVAANQAIRNGINDICIKRNIKFVVPKVEYCGDNAAMIAFRGLKVYQSGIRHSLNSTAFPSLPANFGK